MRTRPFAAKIKDSCQQFCLQKATWFSGHFSSSIQRLPSASWASWGGTSLSSLSSMGRYRSRRNLNHCFRFRWDYFDKYHEKTGGELTGLQKFMDSGVRAQYLESVFPAESFPAWQTIQTGWSSFSLDPWKLFVTIDLQDSTQRATVSLATNSMTERWLWRSVR